MLHEAGVSLITANRGERLILICWVDSKQMDGLTIITSEFFHFFFSFFAFEDIKNV